MPNHKNTYDFICSIGAAGSCTSTLRKARLQFASYPLDWLYGSTPQGRLDILLNRFAHFLDLSSLSFCHENRSDRCYAYFNKDNSLVFNHDFPMDLPLAQAHPAVAAKYQRRIGRMLSLLEQSERVLLVYIETPNIAHPLKQAGLPAPFIAKWEQLRRNYPGKQLDLCYWMHVPELARGTWQLENPIPSITLVKANYQSQHPQAADWEVDIDFTTHVFRTMYRLQMPWAQRAKIWTLRRLISLIPGSSRRNKYRKRFHLTY